MEHGSVTWKSSFKKIVKNAFPLQSSCSCQFIFLSVRSSICFSVCLSVIYLSVCQFVCLSAEGWFPGPNFSRICQLFANLIAPMCITNIYSAFNKKNLDWQNSNKNPKKFCYSLNKENNIGHVMQLYLYISNNNRKSLTFVKL